LPDKSWYEFNLASPEVATVRIYDEIGGFGVSADEFITELDSVEAPLIRVHINSPGGSVDAGIAIMNALISHPSTVETHVDAAAYSIASVIAQGGDLRVMAPHSRMMVHEAMALGMGYAADFDQIAAHLRETTENIAEIYAEKSGKDAAYWRKKMSNETRFTDKQAVEEGLADQVGRVTNLAAFKVAANFEWTKFTNNAAEIKAEMEAVAGTEPTSTEIPEDHLETLEKALDAANAAFKAIRESNKAPEPEPDPRDAARRDLETALARVKL
jgi:ATP-dependent protease ClpP protease subunit